MNNYQIDRQKWAKASIFEQLGNTYAEVGRAMSAKRRGDTDAAQAAAIRAFDLFDATAEVLAPVKSARLREVLRAREQFAAEFTGAGTGTVESYLQPFAAAARMRQLA